MKKISKALVIMLMAATLIIAGCGGKTANPVAQYQPGDDDMSCGQIRQTIQDNQDKIMALIPKKNKTGKNVALGVAGYFLLVPWFFMDFSDAERIEIQAYQQRNNWLRALANKKHCKLTMPKPIKFKK